MRKGNLQDLDFAVAEALKAICSRFERLEGRVDAIEVCLAELMEWRDSFKLDGIEKSNP